MANDTSDFAQLWNEAMEIPIENYKEMRRQITKETTTPLEGEPRTPAEQAEYNARILGDDVTIGGTFEELSARFQVPAGKIPRRLWQAIKAAAREEPE